MWASLHRPPRPTGRGTGRPRALRSAAVAGQAPRAAPASPPRLPSKKRFPRVQPGKLFGRERFSNQTRALSNQTWALSHPIQALSNENIDFGVFNQASCTDENYSPINHGRFLINRGRLQPGELHCFPPNQNVDFRAFNQASCTASRPTCGTTRAC